MHGERRFSMGEKTRNEPVEHDEEAQRVKRSVRGVL